MMGGNMFTRRKFLQTTAAGGAVLATSCVRGLSLWNSTRAPQVLCFLATGIAPLIAIFNSLLNRIAWCAAIWTSAAAFALAK